MSSITTNETEVQKIVNYMLDVCGPVLMGCPRGNYNLPGDFVDNYMFKDVGPSWACNKPIRDLKEKRAILSFSLDSIISPFSIISSNVFSTFPSLFSILVSKTLSVCCIIGTK